MGEDRAGRGEGEALTEELLVARDGLREGDCARWRRELGGGKGGRGRRAAVAGTASRLQEREGKHRLSRGWPGGASTDHLGWIRAST